MLKLTCATHEPSALTPLFLSYSGMELRRWASTQNHEGQQVWLWIVFQLRSTEAMFFRLFSGVRPCNPCLHLQNSTRFLMRTDRIPNTECSLVPLTAESQEVREKGKNRCIRHLAKSEQACKDRTDLHLWRWIGTLSLICILLALLLSTAKTILQSRFHDILIAHFPHLQLFGQSILSYSCQRNLWKFGASIRDLGNVFCMIKPGKWKVLHSCVKLITSF